MKPTTILLSASAPLALAHPLSQPQNQHARRAGGSSHLTFPWSPSLKNTGTSASGAPTVPASANGGFGFSFGNGAGKGFTFGNGVGKSYGSGSDAGNVSQQQRPDIKALLQGLFDPDGGIAKILKGLQAAKGAQGSTPKLPSFSGLKGAKGAKGSKGGWKGHEDGDDEENEGEDEGEDDQGEDAQNDDAEGDVDDGEGDEGEDEGDDVEEGAGDEEENDNADENEGEQDDDNNDEAGSPAPSTGAPAPAVSAPAAPSTPSAPITPAPAVAPGHSHGGSSDDEGDDEGEDDDSAAAPVTIGDSKDTGESGTTSPAPGAGESWSPAPAAPAAPATSPKAPASPAKPPTYPTTLPGLSGPKPPTYPTTLPGLNGPKPTAPAVPAAPAAPSAPQTPAKGNVWQPAVGTPFQIVLNAVVDPTDASKSRAVAYDVDMFGTPKSTIDSLKSQGKKVICYFSAGTSEDWRDDYKQFTSADKGSVVGKGDGTNWAGEKWLNIKNPNPNSATLPNVWQIQRNRIKQAADKGCDAIDPDNMDAYGNTNGLGLTKQDSINYTKFLAKEAASHGMSTGLKNAMDILPNVADVVQFAVNEQCSEFDNDCAMYSNFLKSKPVFRIEYLDDKPSFGSSRLVAGAQASNINKITPICNAPVARGMSTIFKTMDLDGWTQYCDGSTESVRLARGGI